MEQCKNLETLRAEMTQEQQAWRAYFHEFGKFVDSPPKGDVSTGLILDASPDIIQRLRSIG